MIAEHSAEVAAIDAVCWHMLQQHEVETADRLQVIGWTSKRPALPMITSQKSSGHTLEILRKTLKAVSQTTAAEKLMIVGFEEVPVSEYYTLSSL